MTNGSLISIGLQIYMTHIFHLDFENVTGSQYVIVFLATKVHNVLLVFFSMAVRILFLGFKE
jgi:uncharacterized RDD family membrane protein YckC